MPDLLHPNTKGYAVWADSIQPVIDKYFPKTNSKTDNCHPTWSTVLGHWDP